MILVGRGRSSLMFGCDLWIPLNLVAVYFNSAISFCFAIRLFLRHFDRCFRARYLFCFTFVDAVDLMIFLTS